MRTSGDEIERAEQRYRKAYAKIDEQGRRPHPNNVGVPHIPDRPKGMHTETYADLLADLEDARREWDRAFQAELRSMADGLDGW